jgi:uncharacterized protein
MAKTALELTRQEWQAYRPGATGQQLGRKPDPGLHLRRQQAWRVVRKAAKMLREQYSAERVVLFGSLAHRGRFTAWSDIDLAAWGVPAERFYLAVAAVTALSPAFKVDLVDPETCRPLLLQVIEREGIEL